MITREEVNQAAEKARKAVEGARRRGRRGDSRPADSYGQETVAGAIVGLSEVMLAFLNLALYELDQHEGNHDEKGEPK